MAQYRPETFEVLAYNLTVKQLVEKLGYPSVSLPSQSGIRRSLSETCPVHHGKAAAPHHGVKSLTSTNANHASAGADGLPIRLALHGALRATAVMRATAVCIAIHLSQEGFRVRLESGFRLHAGAGPDHRQAARQCAEDRPPQVREDCVPRLQTAQQGAAAQHLRQLGCACAACRTPMTWEVRLVKTLAICSKGRYVDECTPKAFRAV